MLLREKSNVGVSYCKGLSVLSIYEKVNKWDKGGGGGGRDNVMSANQPGGI